MALSVAWHPDPRTTSSPYVGAQADRLRAAGVDVAPFRVTNLAESNTVVHIHWPEHLARSHRRSLRTIKAIFTLGVIALLRGPRRAKVVWTVHNLTPHRSADSKLEAFLEEALFDALAQRVDVVITLVSDHEAAIRKQFGIDAATPVVHIPEGVDHPVEPRQPPTPGEATKLLAVGSMLPYKGYIEAANAFAELDPGLAELRIVGAPTDPTIAERLTSGDFPNVAAIAKRVSNAELESLAGDTNAVFVSNRAPFNSGTPYWALSRNLPVVMVASPLADELAEAFGGEWIYRLQPDFDSKDLRDVALWIRSDRPTIEDSSYSWAHTTQALTDTYRSS